MWGKKFGVFGDVRKFCCRVKFEDSYRAAVFSEQHFSAGPSVSVVLKELPRLKKNLLEEASKRTFLCVASDRSGYAD